MGKVFASSSHTDFAEPVLRNPSIIEYRGNTMRSVSLAFLAGSIYDSVFSLQVILIAVRISKRWSHPAYPANTSKLSSLHHYWLQLEQTGPDVGPEQISINFQIFP